MAPKPLSRARSAGPREGSARPVVKWVGGKSRLLAKLRAHLPSAPIGTYVEAFAGGAALFFALAETKPKPFRKAVLADKNEELVTLYKTLQKDVDGLVTRLRDVQSAYHAMDEETRRAHYYEVREQSARSLSPVERSARLLFLNRTCFNGLWRVNAKGLFNVPFGRYENPRILDEETLRRAHVALRGVDVRHADFAEVTTGLRAGDFVYFDPPYVPVSKTANFTAYAEGRFGKDEQDRLVAMLVRLREARVHAMLSNAKESRELYEKAGLFVHEVSAPRAINSDPKKRGDVGEIIVTTYDARGKVKAAPKVRAAATPVRRRAAS